MNSENADLLRTQHLSFNDSLDIACCIFSPQEKLRTQFKPIPVPLDTTRPSIGDVVHMVALGGMDILDYSPGVGPKRAGEAYVVHRRVNIRVGVVTGTYPQGYRQYRWPCFTTSIPAEPGMSGGFVFLPRDGMTIAACGVVCADNSAPETARNYFLCGESVIAYAWPALSLVVPTVFSPDSPMTTLYDLMKKGGMPKAEGGIDHIQVIDAGNGEYTLIYGEK